VARTTAVLLPGSRVTDFISFGILARAFPVEKVRAALAASGRTSLRQRDLPAHVVVYYVLALSLYMQASSREVLRCLLEGLQWLRLGAKVNIAGISQARTRLGSEVMRRLHDELVVPVAVAGTRGAWFRRWRLVSLDGSTLDIADTPARRPRSAVRAPATGRPLFRKSASSPWSRTAPMSCSVRRCRVARAVRSP